MHGLYTSYHPRATGKDVVHTSFPVSGGWSDVSRRMRVRPQISGKNVCVDVFSGHFRDWERERPLLSYEDASYEDDPISEESL